MPTLTLKGLPDALYERLKAQAATNRRSLNREVLVCLEQAVNAAPMDVTATLARIDGLRERAAAGAVAMPQLTDHLLRQAKDSGRE